MNKRNLRNAKRYSAGEVPKSNMAMVCVAADGIRDHNTIRAILKVLDTHDAGYGTHRNRETDDLVHKIRNCFPDER